MEQVIQSSTGMSEYFWNQLPIEGPAGDDESTNGQTIFLRTEWSSDIIKFRLSVMPDLNRAWEANAKITDLHRRAEEFEIPVSEFMQETRQCLTKLDGLKGFKYDCDWSDDEKSCRFTWKKCSGLTLVYGQVDLELPVLTRTLNIVQEFAALKENEMSLRGAYEKLKDCYISTSERVKEDNKVVLSKCILLINSKKAKIRELEDKLSQFQTERQQQQPVASTQDSEDIPISNLRLRKRARSLNRIFSQSSSQDSEPVLLSSLPKRSKICEKEAETVIEDVTASSPSTVFETQPADDDIFDQL